MPNRIYNYAAFYVAEPFSTSNLAAYATPDFLYYNTLKAWRANDSSFPFNDAHATTYSVRDNSDWERTLKPRLHERLQNSKNIILFLSSNTRHSRALNEEIDYGVGQLGLPVIVIYPEYNSKEDIAENGRLKQTIRNLWNNLPHFRDQMENVPTIHIPMNKSLISKALKDPDLTIQHKTQNGRWFFR